MARFRRFLPALMLALVPALALGYIERPVTVSFFPPLSTNGAQGPEVRTRFSFSVIGGYVGAVDGFELGGVFNIVRDGFRGLELGGAVNAVGGVARGVQLAGGANIVGGMIVGVQAAGGANVVGGMMDGVQLAGGANINGGGLRTAQLAGGVNFVGGYVEAVQLAGGANICGGDLRGLQLAGGANITSGNGSGAQIAGGANICGGLLSGCQLAGGANIAEEFSGAQVGTVNIAGRGKGLMLGVVNVVDELDGPAIGLVSIVGNGMFHVDATFADHAVANVALKFGSKTVYNTVVFGWKPQEPARVLLGYGIGYRMRRDRLFLDVDAVGHSVREPDEPFEGDNLPLLAQLRFTGGWQVMEGFSLIAGIAGNVWVADEGEYYHGLYDLVLYDNGSQNTRVLIWPGFSVGVELL